MASMQQGRAVAIGVKGSAFFPQQEKGRGWTISYFGNELPTVSADDPEMFCDPDSEVMRVLSAHRDDAQGIRFFRSVGNQEIPLIGLDDYIDLAEANRRQVDRFQVAQRHGGLLNRLWDLSGRQRVSDILGLPDYRPAMARTDPDDVIELTDDIDWITLEPDDSEEMEPEIIYVNPDFIEEESLPGQEVYPEPDFQLDADSGVIELDGSDIIEESVAESMAEMTRIFQTDVYRTVKGKFDGKGLSLEETDRMVEAELMRKVLANVEEELGLKVQEYTGFDGRLRYQVIGEADVNGRQLPTPEYFIENALDAVKRFDEAMGLDRKTDHERYDRYREFAYGDVMQEREKKLFEQAHLEILAKDVRKFRKLYDARQDTQKFFTDRASRAAAAALDDRMDDIAGAILDDVALQNIDRETSEKVCAQLMGRGNREERDRAQKVLEYRRLVNEGGLYNLRCAKDIVLENFDGAAIRDELLDTVELQIKHAARAKLERTLLEEGYDAAENLCDVMRASIDDNIREVGKTGRRIAKLLKGGSWKNLRTARSMVETEFGPVQGGKIAAKLIDRRLDDMAYELAGPIASGTLSYKTFIPRDTKKQIHARLLKTKETGAAILALGIADRHLPHLRQKTLQCLGSCLAEEYENRGYSLKEKRERQEYILSELDLMLRPGSRTGREAPEYLRLIAHSHVNRSPVKRVTDDEVTKKAYFSPADMMTRKITVPPELLDGPTMYANLASNPHTEVTRKVDIKKLDRVAA